MGETGAKISKRFWRLEGALRARRRVTPSASFQLLSPGSIADTSRISCRAWWWRTQWRWCVGWAV
eukprot:scaffold29226_cov110-Isochrysis_galbana.AAC.3